MKTRIILPNEMRGMKSRLKEFVVMCILLFCVGVISAQVSKDSNKHPQPTFRVDSQKRDSILSFATNQSNVIRAVSVCAVWKLTDTVERMLWSISDSKEKVSAQAGGKAVCSAVSDVAALPHKIRNKPLTFSVSVDSVQREALQECLFYPFALSVRQRVATESYLALK